MQPQDRARREQVLRRAVLSGDEAAWLLLYDEASAGLFAYVLWRCGGRRDWADEAAQETWLTAVRRLRTFDPSAGAFAAWLRGIAVNVLRNLLRREGRRARRTQPLDAEPSAAGSAPDDGERIARALAALPEHYEAVLRAKYLDGLSVAAIAQQRGDSSKAIESLLTRARQAFRDTYLELE